MLCRSAGTTGRGGPKSGTREEESFAGLARSYGVQLEGAEAEALKSLPNLPIAGVSTVLVATEAKAAMTAFLKARPRLKDELTSSHQTIHGDNQHAVAAGLVIVNAAETFISPDKNKHDLNRCEAVTTLHRQPDDAAKVVAGLRELQRRSSVQDAGFDGIGVITLNCRNDGSPVTVVTRHPPAPLPNDDFDYGRFVHRLTHLYATRFVDV